jgi:hypothetical protein
MEKFYIVTEKSDLRQRYLEYEKNLEEVNEVIKEFFEENSIKTDEYYCTSESLYIVPTNEDIELYEKMLKKPLDNDLREFKVKSKIATKWQEKLRGKILTVKQKPFLPTYFNSYGKSRSRLFQIGDTVYCSYENGCEFKNPEGFQEIKASEFYKLTEEN